jgi:hypothetical protein
VKELAKESWLYQGNSRKMKGSKSWRENNNNYTPTVNVSIDD